MKRLALGILLTSIAGAASAADLPAAPTPYSKAPAIVSPVTNWTGFYIGAMGGYGSETGSNPSNSPNIKGGIAGGTVGYNWQFSSLVAGIEADGAWANINATVNGAIPLGPLGAPSIPFSATNKIDAMGTVRGRIGVAFDQVLLYGTAGLALADNTASVTSLGVTVSDSHTQIGWTAGAGAEWMFLPHWSLKAEYLYRSFGSVNLLGGPTGTVQINSGQVGVNFHF